jgi:hypothetical protein
MAIIKGIHRLIMPAAGKGMPEVVSYFRERAWNTSTVDIVTVDEVYPFGTLGGLETGSTLIYTPGGPLAYEPPILQATVIAGSLVFPVTELGAGTEPLRFWYNPLYPEQKKAWFQIGTEVIEYTSINPANTSASGYDEFVCSSATYRGQFGSTAAGHTAPADINPVTAGIVSDIELDTEAGEFTVRTKHTLMQDSSGTYGASGWQEAAITYVNASIPKDQVSMYESQSGYVNYS